LKAGLKIRQGHIDEVPGAGYRRPVGGWCWELRKKGDPQRHAGVDPASVETQAGGYIYSYYLGLNLYRGEIAVYSVACLEWCWRIMDHVFEQEGPLFRNYCHMKPTLQKRLEIGEAVRESL